VTPRRKPFGAALADFLAARLAHVQNGAEISALVSEVRARAVEHAGELRPSLDEPPMACAAGCDHCCHLRVDTSPLEVMALAWWLDQFLDASEKTRLRDRVELALSESRGLSEEKFAAAHIACPLLANGRCTAYEVRPFDCQGYMSADARVCEQARSNYDIQAIPINGRRYKAFVEARRALNRVSIREGRDAAVLELISALHIVLAGDDVVARWLAGEPVFAGAAIDAPHSARRNPRT
jgi:Fe-S-cluster containining protein